MKIALVRYSVPALLSCIDMSGLIVFLLSDKNIWMNTTLIYTEARVGWAQK